MQPVNGVAYIEAEDAVIYWGGRTKDHPVQTVYIDRAHWLDDGGKYIPSGCAWVGRGCSSWEDISEDDRALLMMQMAFEMIVRHDYDPAVVMREFCKIRQFYEQGERSYPMRRAISHVTHSSAREDWPPGSGEGYPRLHILS